MHSNESMIVVNHTETAIERLKAYLKTTDLYQYSVRREKNTVIVEFHSDSMPTDQHIDEIRELFYWTNILDVSDIEGLVHFYKETDTMLIAVNYYDMICSVYNQLVEFQAVVKKLEINMSDFSFTYTIPGKLCLDYAHLSTIHKLIDPDDEELKQISVFRMDEASTLRIKLSSFAK